jgi:uncharacterized protein with PIN domain
MPGYRFMVDENVGRLAKWLRILGYDTLLFEGGNDGAMVNTAQKEGRLLLTRDREIMRRRPVAGGFLRVILIQEDDPVAQLRQVAGTLHLDTHQTFSRCSECNHLLEPRTPEQVTGRVPPYVFSTQQQYMECPACGRIYWRGTHWEALSRALAGLKGQP